MRKTLICGVLSLGLLASTATSAFATTQSYSSSGHSFSNAWTEYDATSNWSIEYGYNTSWINEDYTSAVHDYYHHTAIVENGNGSYSDEDSAGDWANISVTHSGSTVYYRLSY